MKTVMLKLYEGTIYTLSIWTDTGLWNYQILLLVHGEVNGQNPLVQPTFTCQKIDSFLIYRRQHCCGYSLEAPQGGASNEYPQHVFFEK